MRVDDLLQDLSWALYVLIFVLVALRAAQQPTRAHVDMALFFGAITLVVILTGLTAALPPGSVPGWLTGFSAGLVMALPYLLLRLVVDFARVPMSLVRTAEVGLALSIVAVFVLPTPLPSAAVLLLVAYFVPLILYDSWAFMRAAERGRGVTRRRMQAAAGGSVCLALVLVLAGVTAITPGQAELLTGLSRLGGLAAGVCYFIGFTPPTWLRRGWQEPELREFLNRAATLPRLPEMLSIVRELERGAADSLGGAGAVLGLWDPAARVLRIYPPDSVAESTQQWEVDPATRPTVGRAFLEQRPRLIRDLHREDLSKTALHEVFGARSALTAPISVGDKRLGVLAVYAAREPVFAESDLELIALLANQAAAILESRSLIEEASRARARQEATRLKEDFLSSAAHDLKTPLTGMLTQAQLLQRRALRDPGQPVDQVGLERLVREGRRLKALVVELLDASGFDPDEPPARHQAVDLTALAREVCARKRAEPSACVLRAAEPVIGEFDPVRMRQLLEHLVSNAITYSPAGTDVSVEVWQEGDRARIRVRDQGIGIPPEDLPWLFQRFHRGSNVDDRRFAGLGLGLHISRQIVEQHGGRIWVESSLRRGSTFEVELPLHARPSSARQPVATELASV